MNNISFSKNVLPHIIAIVAFFIMTIIIYRPIIFENKSMNQNDINQGLGAGKEIVDYRAKTGEEALWTNSMFGGMPAYLINIRWTGAKFIDMVQNFLKMYLPSPASENLIAFVAFYILLLAFGVRPYLAIAGAFAFGLSTFYFVSIQAGHVWKVRAIAYMPMVIAGIHLIFKRKYLIGFILTVLSFALELNANHLQITYYLFLMLLIYGLAELITVIKKGELPTFIKSFGVIMAAVFLAIGVNFGRLWATYEYGKYSIRGKSELSTTPKESSEGLDREYAFRWSSGKWESFTLLIPHLYGGASGVFEGENSETGKVLRSNNYPQDYVRAYLGYWGSQPGTAGPAYVGAIVCFLFILAFFFVDKKHKYWLSAAILFSIVLSWGHNFPTFNNLMFDFFPGYNKFRAVTMAIIIALLGIPLMSFMGLEKVLREQNNKETIKKLLIAGGITIGLIFFVQIFTSIPLENVPDFLRKAVKEDRQSIIALDVFRSFFYVAISITILYFYLKGNLNISLVIVIFILLTVLDLNLVNDRYINDSAYQKKSKNTFFTKTPADEKILEDKSLSYRVLGLPDPFNDAKTSYFHHSIGGYHGAKMRRYSDLIINNLQNEIQAIVNDRRLTPQNSKVLNMLNTKYLLAGQQANAVIQNPYAYGNAWFVKDIKLVDSPDDEIQTLDKTGLDSVAVIDKNKFDVVAQNYSTNGSIKLIEYEPNKLVYKSDNSGDGFAVFSEIYYPNGWEATIDGKLVPIVRANYILRSLPVPKGNHEIIFSFKPDAYFVGNKISLFSNILLIGVILAGVFMGYKKIAKRD